MARFVIIRKNEDIFSLASKRLFKSIMAANTYRKNVLSKNRGELFIVPTKRATTLKGFSFYLKR